MKLIEDYIRRHFREATSTKGVDADELWAEIEAGLPPEEGDPPGGPAVFPRYSIGLLLLVALGSAGYLLWPRDDGAPGRTAGVTAESVATDRETNTSRADASDAEISTAFTPAANDSDERAAPGPSAALREEAGLRPVKEIIAPASAPAKTLENQAKIWPVAGRNDGAGLATEGARKRIADAGAGSDDGGAVGSDFTESATDVGEAATPSRRDAKLVNATATTRKLVPATPLQQLPLLSLPDRAVALELPPIVPVAFTPKPFRRTGDSRFELSATAGTNLMLRNYLAPEENGTRSALNAAVGQRFGQSVALEVSYGLNYNFRVSAGLAYLRTHNTFRHTIRRDSSVAHPSFPYRDIAAEYVRRVEHNNYQTMLAVPLLLEYRKTFGRFRAGLAAGLAFNYQLGASGRTLASPGEVVAYDARDAGNTVPTPDFFLSYRLRPSLSFAPKANAPWRLLLRTDLQYYRFGTSPVSGLGQRSFLFGGSVGVQYGF